jgi:hypothetical protein
MVLTANSISFLRGEQPMLVVAATHVGQAAAGMQIAPLLPMGVSTATDQFAIIVSEASPGGFDSLT